MCKKSIYVVSIVLVLGLASTVSAELVAYWRFEGDFVDATGNGHDGTPFDTPAIVDDPVRGQVLEANGTGRVRVADAPDLNYGENESFSYMAWVNYDPGLVGSGWRTVFVKGRTQNGGGTTYNEDVLYGFWVNPDGNWHVSCGNVRADTDPAQAGEWHHLATVQDGDAGTVTFYIDGQEIPAGGGSAGPCQSPDWPLFFGAAGTDQGSFEAFGGRIDEAQIYNHALTEAEILAAMEGGEGYPYASRPVPEDGTLYAGTWVSCQWNAGDFAASHDVYFSDSFADVDAGTPDAFRGNELLGTEYYIAGLSGYDYPEGLENGTTYYWRIDAVKVGDPNSPWKGKVWSFSIPTNKAHDPVPADGSRFINPDVTLSWTPGLNPFMHHVYFGDNPDDVAAGTGGTDKGQRPAASFVPGTLEQEKTYYWRIDETDSLSATHTGDVWSFKTMPDIPVSDPNLICWWKLDEGQGTRAVDWSGHGNHGTLAGDPQWVAGYDGDALDFDGTGDYVNFAGVSGLPAGSSARSMCGWARTDSIAGGWRWITAYGSPVTSQAMFIGINGSDLYGGGYGDDILLSGFWEIGVWHHICLTYDGTTARLYADGIQVASEAKNWSLVLSLAHIGRQVNDIAEFWDGLIDDVRIYNKVLTQEEIMQAMRGDPLLAWGPSPADRSTQDIHLATPLSWSAGDKAAQHDVYFGTDEDTMEDADTSDTTGIYRVRQAADSYTPPEGVEWGGGPYYWRIDEYNTDATISKGRVWSFLVSDYLIVDDFEDYKGDEVPVTEQIWGQWRDGLGYGAVTAPPYYPGNGTGSEIGDVTTTSYTEEGVLHGGQQAMPYWYNNNKPDKFKYSEAKLTLTAQRNWSDEGVKALSLWFQGRPASTGSFVEAPAGTYTMTASGADIWDIGPGVGQYHDEFHFAYKQITGAGTIIAKVESVQNTNDWAKAGVMIRETLDANSPHAFACMTPANGVSAQGRPDNGAASLQANQTGITTPHWVRLQRDAGGTFTVSHSADGSTWVPVTGATPQTVQMNTNLYIGLALTSHDAALTCEAVFSNVTISGNVSGQWAHQDIGIESNAAERMYVAIANNTGLPGVVYHDDDAATQIDTWTEWNIDLKDFQDQGIDLTDVNSIAIGFGDRNNPQVGGAGKMYFDDIALYRPRYVPGMGTPLAGDLSSDGVVDYRDVRILAYQWLFETEVPDWDHRVAYWDAAYPTGWADVQVTEAVRDHLALNGYTVVNAAQLKTWMDARIADGTSSVVVFCKDIVPDTVAETMDATCTIRQYLDAGGKVVWYADWPFYYQGLSDGTSAPTWGGAGATNILGFNASGGPNDSGEEVFITAAGTAWGLTQTWPSSRPTPPMAENLTALATISGGSAAGWAKHYLPGDYYRGFFRIADFNVGPGDTTDLLPNVLSVAESKGSLAADLNGDMTVDFKDFAILLNQWLDEQLWPEW